jgi:hypothetical protein
MPVQFLDPIPRIPFDGDPIIVEIIGTSRFLDDLTVYIRVCYSVFSIVYLATVTGAYRADSCAGPARP